MTLSFKCETDGVKINNRAKYVGQRSFRSKVIVRVQKYTQTHTYTGPIALPGPLKWSVANACLKLEDKDVLPNTNPTQAAESAEKCRFCPW